MPVWELGWISVQRSEYEPRRSTTDFDEKAEDSVDLGGGSRRSLRKQLPPWGSAPQIFAMRRAYVEEARPYSMGSARLA